MNWKSLLEANLDRLFQTALLLTADPCRAELALTQAIEHFDLSAPPSPDAIKRIELEIVFHGFQAGPPPSPALTARTRTMIQPGLWPILQLPPDLRACFVLIVMLRCRSSVCASLAYSKTDDGTVGRWLHSAVLAFHRSAVRGASDAFEVKKAHSKE